METYKIIGGDGKEYGPASLDEMRQWIRDGRVGRQTLVWHSGMNTWAPASQYPELSATLDELYGAAPREMAGVRVGFWPRLGAYILDRFLLMIIVSVVWVPVSNVLGIPTPTAPSFAGLEEALRFLQENSQFYVAQTILSLLLHCVYDVGLNGRFGATVGKMALGARIIRMDGTPLGYKGALLRWLGCRLSDIICYIGYLLVGFRKDKRGLHDLLAGTQVIYRR
jgi:uncharacterized RDD family membrane protein YckC